MPIDPKLYPAEWRKVVAAVRRRAGNRCEECQAPNGECGAHHPLRGEWRNVGWWSEETASSYGTEAIGEDLPDWWPKRMTRIILTASHRDAPDDVCRCEEQTGRKCGNPDHLRYLCQRHHLLYDQPRHRRNAALTRHRKRLKTQPELFPL